MMKNFELIRSVTADALAQAVAGAWLNEIEMANRAGRPHCVALSGGRITQKLFASAVEQGAGRGVSFENVHFFWADERCVSPSDPESNFRMARELLFVPLNISEKQIHRVRGEDPPEAAARAAETEIRRIISASDAVQSALDLVFLGLGEDGHVASLFPGEPEVLAADPAVYRAVKNSPKPPPNRVTLGYTAIAAARQVWMLASGSGKDVALRQSLSPGGKTPFAEVLNRRRQTKIYTDIVSF